MKLSEAMRLGAMMKPQIYDDMYDGIGTCAVAAAADAIGKLSEILCGSAVLTDWWPELETLHKHVCCPECLASFQSLDSLIVHLNDTHKLTRETIADWLATVEEPGARMTLASVEGQ